MNYSKIHELAKRKNISMKDVASKLGLTRTGLSLAISKKTLKIETLEKIAKEFDVPIWDFFDQEIEQQYQRKIDSLENEFVDLDKKYSNTIDLANEKERYIKHLTQENDKLKAKINNMQLAITLLTTQGKMLSTKSISIDAYDCLLTSMIDFIESDYKGPEYNVIDRYGPKFMKPYRKKK